ncbi:ISL3 family transposase [Enterococcus sp. DIV0187]|uniref:ISL3 family transposase n=1 Tax=Enterococcus sp. DIV0187 TaxID=2774644 RepID=UPI003F22F44E
MIDKAIVTAVCIDDFALKKRERYGTIMVDLETHRVIDLLPSRDAEEVTEWLCTFPNLELVSRDGSITYKNAISIAHPEVRQVSDRFHLYKNLIDYGKAHLKKVMKARILIPATRSIENVEIEQEISSANENRKLTLEQKFRRIKSLADAGLTQTQICEELNMDVRSYKKLIALTDKEVIDRFRTIANERSQEKVLMKMELVEEIRSMRQNGLSVSAIQRDTDLARRTIYRYLSPDFDPVHGTIGKYRQSVLDRYRSFIDQKLELGVMGSVIEREIREMGYEGSSSNLRHYCSRWKKEQIHPDASKATEVVGYTEMIKRQRLFKLLYHPLEEVSAITKEQFEQVLKTVPQFQVIYSLIWSFKKLVSEKEVNQLSNWIAEAQKLGISEINSFINGIIRDIDAVQNAITFDESNGLAEGSVNKVKVIKRIMYGRCGFNTLRTKTLLLEKMRGKPEIN